MPEPATPSALALQLPGTRSQSLSRSSRREGEGKKKAGQRSGGEGGAREGRGGQHAEEGEEQEGRGVRQEGGEGWGRGEAEREGEGGSEGEGEGEVEGDKSIARRRDVRLWHWQVYQDSSMHLLHICLLTCEHWCTCVRTLLCVLLYMRA